MRLSKIHSVLKYGRHEPNTTNLYDAGLKFEIRCIAGRIIESDEIDVLGFGADFMKEFIVGRFHGDHVVSENFGHHHFAQLNGIRQRKCQPRVQPTAIWLGGT